MIYCDLYKVQLTYPEVVCVHTDWVSLWVHCTDGISETVQELCIVISVCCCYRGNRSSNRCIYRWIRNIQIWLKTLLSFPFCPVTQSLNNVLKLLFQTATEIGFRMLNWSHFELLEAGPQQMANHPKSATGHLKSWSGSTLVGVALRCAFSYGSEFSYFDIHFFQKNFLNKLDIGTPPNGNPYPPLWTEQNFRVIEHDPWCLPSLTDVM